MVKHIQWSDEARADLRAMDQNTALHLLKSFARFLKTGTGDVRQLHGFDPPLHRLRIGDVRLIFRKRGQDTVEVVRVRNRKDVYR